MTESHDEVAAIILAAGRSSRMGAFKPLLAFGPKTVVDSSIDAMREAGIEKVILVIGSDQHAKDLQLHLANSNVVFAVNPDPQSEMDASVAIGVRAVPDGVRGVIINPVDHAAVPSEVMSSLILGWKRGAKLLKPVTAERGGHPVLVDFSFRNELLNLDAQLGLKGLFDAHQAEVKRVFVESNYIARDMDTWDDYRALHEDLFGEPPPERAR
jgi:molybdenum cofactor cytidylyltransferase